jgi:hypothetical protein
MLAEQEKEGMLSLPLWLFTVNMPRPALAMIVNQLA